MPRRLAVTVIGGGIGGLVCAITAAESGGAVHLYEAHEQLGGRGRTSSGPYKANLGPHVLYKDGPFWAWLRQRELLPAFARTPIGRVRFRWRGELRRTPPPASLAAILRLRRLQAPVERSFSDWARQHAAEETAQMLSAAAGVFTFHHDPGSLSAAFVWPRTVRALLTPPPAARYFVGGWSALVDSLERRAHAHGIRVETGARVTAPSGDALIVATELADARRLLGDDSLDWPSGHTVCIDLGLRARSGDPFVVSDLDEAGWVERYTAADPSLAPPREELVQAQMPIRPGEPIESAAERLEVLLDLAFPERRNRQTWRRRQVMAGRSGALDPPGRTWRDRPAIQRGDGIFVAGDMTAQPGLLGEVAWASAVAAGRAATAHARGSRPLSNGRPSPRRAGKER
jgi:phytoene dehydrogenase-like protein